MQASPGAKADSSVIGVATADPFKGVRRDHDSAPFGIVPAPGLFAEPAVFGDESCQSLAGRGGEARLRGKAWQSRALESASGALGHSPTGQRDFDPQVPQ